MSVPSTRVSTKKILLLGLAMGLVWGGAMAVWSQGSVFAAHVAPSPGTVDVDVSQRPFDVRGAVMKTGVWMVGGLFFGGAMAGFLLLMRRRETKKPIDLEPGETLVIDGPANHWKGSMSVGGWLYLTDRRVRFRSHPFNLWWNHDESYPLARIVGVEPKATMGLVPNGLVLRLEDWRVEQFVVQGRAAWLEAIEKARPTPRGGVGT